ncbi:tetratricopeptide repeat protein [Pseudoalteromonas luteoviolacea]|uniref:Tetratricopeptide repeat protein n=1 Tax=Pseudoalteromonas luteoviolacea S4054 TaxID=1129367 RepID=A0A0F6AI75_9GAMM|nr:tetratricopeptide repeat protein [Pseudoalteromonas luteoviolacea]AOT07717.1 hypothetical protein S4054249_07600 [Pseudoalteromonas luteoviolacea]AOT12633.1 hypothetical protein S40542_07600 [Pseudoalteromonas luteoviolacea]AOT17547.1 hypothetical protein S4054_07600 [Pseudoalteromonas luteoviolacea]KKE85496.1 hypothetical protein N479_25750 [Pseudoalteromonas luteoviolacea S4054]KZN76439.1 hypothetical protein N481_26440 [Pseudoalteromonas luteoviolacea S4047-1]
MNKFYIFVSVVLIALCSPTTFAKDKGIVDEYQIIKANYVVQFKEGNYEEAYKAAENLLHIDPTDPVAYLKLIMAARELGIDMKVIRHNFAPWVSESNMKEQELKLIADMLIESPRVGLNLKNIGDTHSNLKK